MFPTAVGTTLGAPDVETFAPPTYGASVIGGGAEMGALLHATPKFKSMTRATMTGCPKQPDHPPPQALLSMYEEERKKKKKLVIKPKAKVKPFNPCLHPVTLCGSGSVEYSAEKRKVKLLVSSMLKGLILKFLSRNADPGSRVFMSIALRFYETAEQLHNDCTAYDDLEQSLERDAADAADAADAEC